MSDHTTTTTGAERGQVSTAAAEIYESFFVPALFGQFPRAVLDHAGVTSGAAVVDVGCGTGILARAAHARVRPGGHVAAVDPNDGMLAVARRAGPGIEWRRGCAEALPFGDDSFDHAISQFAAMFFADRTEAVREMGRVAVEGGTVTIATWCGLDRTPGYQALVALLADELGEEAADALRHPFTLGRLDDVRRLVEPLGADVRAEEVTGTARFPSIAAWIHTEVRGWTLAELIDDRTETALLVRAERDLSRFLGADGSVAFPAPAIVATVVNGS